MSEKENLIAQLTMIGQPVYYAEHSKILEQMKPDGDFTSHEWNEASAEALIKAVAAMIAEYHFLSVGGDPR